MKHTLIFTFFLVLTLGACVSKKKYNALNQQHQQALNDKVTLEDVFTKMSVENDSLKNQIILLDSLLRQASLKKNTATPATLNNSNPAAKAKPTTISKAQEYDTKALYIYSISKYIFWPGTINHDKFTIGIIGQSKLNDALATHMYGKKVHGLPVIVEPYNPGAGKFYHVVVIVENKQQEFYKNSKHLQGQPVLIIEENQTQALAGAHVFIYPDGDKIKFRLNEKQIQKAGLNVSGMLIKLAESSK
ncbi:MAG TPA: YfiR family protein [Bacteroidia bacterium]|nr:YfiR family protein [Bacteroidia bacterium]